MIVLRFAAAVIVSSSTIAIALHTSDRSLRAVLLAYSFLFLFYPAQPDFIAIGMHRSRVYSISRWITSAVFISGVLTLTRISIRAWMVPIVYSTSLLASATYGYFALWRSLPISTEGANSGFGALLRGAAVVVAAQFLQMGQASVDTILLTTWKLPVAQIGDYNAVARLTQTGSLPFVALIYSLAPMYVKHMSDHDIEQINGLERRFRACLLVLGIVGAIMITTIGPQVLGFVRGHQIPTAYQLAPTFAIAYLLVALHNSYTAILVYAGATYLYLLTYALGLIGTLVSAIVLIPRFGTIGSAWSEVTGLTIILCASYLFHRRLLQQQKKESGRSLATMIGS
jgi:O-antigen/teichoic acid export membrane protein